MKLTSPAFENGKDIPSEYTADGENISPPLEWSDVPEGTESLTLIMEDPDAPSGEWIHWLVWNIPPAVMRIEAGKTPAGAEEGHTSFEEIGYGGPHPPSGTHRYRFKLYALNTVLNLPESAHKEELERAILDHIIAHAELTGLYRARSTQAHAKKK